MKTEVKIKSKKRELVHLEGMDIGDFFLYRGHIYCCLDISFVKDRLAEGRNDFLEIFLSANVTPSSSNLSLNLNTSALDLTDGVITLFDTDDKVEKLEEVTISFE